MPRGDDARRPGAEVIIEDALPEDPDERRRFDAMAAALHGGALELVALLLRVWDRAGGDARIAKRLAIAHNEVVAASGELRRCRALLAAVRGRDPRLMDRVVADQVEHERRNE
jgi:hypothetical protein